MIFIIPFLLKWWKKLTGKSTAPDNSGGNSGNNSGGNSSGGGSGLRPQPTQDELKDIFLEVAQEYGIEYARIMESQMRWETGHFESGQWRKCFTAGIIASGGSYPWGWSSMERFNREQGYNFPASAFGTVYFSRTSDGNPHTYVSVPTPEFGIKFMAWFIKNVRNGRYWEWYGLVDTPKRRQYKAAVLTVRPRFLA